MTIKDFMEKKICVRFDNPSDMAKFLSMCEEEGLKWIGGKKATDFPYNIFGSGNIFFDSEKKRIVLTFMFRDGYELVNAKEFFQNIDWNERKEVDSKELFAKKTGATFREETREPFYRVVIDCDGRKTTARLQVNGRTVKVASTKKNPNDAFSLTKACVVVMDRLFAKKNPKKDDGKVKDGEEAYRIHEKGFHIHGTDSTWSFTDEMVKIIARR